MAFGGTMHKSIKCKQKRAHFLYLAFLCQKILLKKKKTESEVTNRIKKSKGPEKKRSHLLKYGDIQNKKKKKLQELL